MLRLSGNLKTVFTSKSQLMGTVVPLPQYESTTASSLRLLFSRNLCEPGLKPRDVPPQPTAALLQNINSPASAR
jgi:hypothetical protein